MTFHPDSHLPDCMMPDGGECCVGYRALAENWHAQRRKIERLWERCEAYKGQVEAGAAEIERLKKLVTQMARDSDAEFARLTGIAFDIRAATIEECAPPFCDLAMIWQGRCNALRLLDKARSKSDIGTLSEADAYEHCANENARLRKVITRMARDSDAEFARLTMTFTEVIERLQRYFDERQIETYGFTLILNFQDFQSAAKLDYAIAKEFDPMMRGVTHKINFGAGFKLNGIEIRIESPVHTP